MTDDERDEPTVQAIVEATMNHVSVARSPRGEVHGYGFILPICTATVALLPPAGQLRRLIDCWVANEGATIADSADQSRAWVISTVVCGEYRAEMAEAALREYGLTVVVRGGQYLAVTGRDVFSSLLEAAGGRKLITLGVSVPGGPPLHGWLLDIDSFGVEEWTAAMMTGRKPVPRLHGKELETAVQEAVVNWRSDEHLARSRLLSRLSGESRTPTALRELLRSAMQQARVQARDDLAIRAVELAYVERSGSIERVADQLHVSRATLFRLLRRGVEEIAHQLA